jgi:hypothetical protein
MVENDVAIEIEKSNFIPLDECNKNSTELIRMGIKGQIKLAVMNGKTSKFQLLSSGQLQKVYADYPNRVFIRLINGRLSSSGKNFHQVPYDQKINHLDLWVDLRKLNSLISKTNEQTDGKDEPLLLLEKSPYWQKLNKCYLKAIFEYPAWKEKAGHVKKTGNCCLSHL